MEGIIYYLLTGLGCLAVGAVVGSFVRKFWGQQRLAESERMAKTLLAEAESKAKSIQREAELEAKDQQLKAKSQFEREISERQREHHAAEKRMQSKEDNLEKKSQLMERKEEEVFKTEQKFKDREVFIKKQEERYAQMLSETQLALERAAGITREEAQKQLRESLLEQTKQETAQMLQKMEEETKAEAEKKAQYIIANTVERIAGEYTAERSISSVPLPSEEIKGRIIGREGRNIRAFEAATGVDVIIDDTPDAVVLSGHNPIRREIARLTMERLLKDGRIHPTRIEEMVERATKEINDVIMEAGEQAFLELKLPKAHLEIVKLLGMLKYRYSYAQNVLRHSIEVGFLCGMMASEIGIDDRKARRAGLLHDIGKAVSHEVEGAHALIGMDFCRKFKEDEAVCHAVGAHHEDIRQESALDFLVDAADAISGARPGARRETLESYVKRLEDLEKISTSFKGVQKAYAIQAGREVRVMVDCENVNDSQAYILSKDIARKIEHDMTYPGQIKVTVIREMRATEYAK